MADDDKNDKDEKKGGGGLSPIILIVVVLVVGLGAGAGGIFLAPMMMGQPAAAAPPPPPPAPSALPSASPDMEAETVSEFNPIVVDVWDEAKVMHHVKVAVSVELAKDVEEEEFKKYRPRGREAATAYLRAQSFERLTDPKEFPRVKKELAEAIAKAVGYKRLQRVLVTDFVSQ